MTRDESSVKICLVGFPPLLESRLISLCRRYSCRPIIYREFDEILKDSCPPKIDILILDRNSDGPSTEPIERWGKTLGSLLPTIILGGPNISHWAAAPLPSTVKQFAILGDDSAQFEATLSKILASQFKLKATKEPSS